MPLRQRLWQAWKTSGHAARGRQGRAQQCLAPAWTGSIVPSMDVLLRALGECIRTLRESGGLSVSALARRSDLSIRFVTELLAGRANVSVVNLARVGQALETSAAALLADAEAKVAKGDDRPTVIALL